MRLTMQPVCDRTGLTSDSATELSGCDKAASCKVSFAVQQKTPPQSNFALIRTCDLDPATTVNWPLNTQTQTIVFHPGGAIMFLRGFFAAISNKITSTLEGIFYRYHHPKDGIDIWHLLKVGTLGCKPSLACDSLLPSPLRRPLWRPPPLGSGNRPRASLDPVWLSGKIIIAKKFLSHLNSSSSIKKNGSPKHSHGTEGLRISSQLGRMSWRQTPSDMWVLPDLNKFFHTDLRQCKRYADMWVLPDLN